jgi:hypothetical protein
MEENKKEDNKEEEKTREKKILDLLDKEFQPLGQSKKVRVNKQNFDLFWVKVKQESEMRGLPLAAINLDELYSKLIEWQDKNLVPMGIRIKIGYLDQQTVSYAVK